MQTIKDIIVKNIKFWEFLENLIIDIKNLYIFFQDLSILYKKVEELWLPLIQYQDSMLKIKFYYFWYKKNIRNMKIKNYDDIIKKSQKKKLNLTVNSDDFINFLEDELSVFNDNTCVLHVGGNFNNLGTVLNHSKDFNRLFGFTKNEIIGKNLKSLMTKNYAKNHNSYMNNFIIHCKNNVAYKQLKAFAKVKEGFIFPIWLMVKLNISFKGDLKYIGLIKPIFNEENNYEYIIMDEKGNIEGISRKFSSKLDILPEYINSNPLNILLMAPKLVSLFAYNKYSSHLKNSLSVNIVGLNKKNFNKKKYTNDEKSPMINKKFMGLNGKISNKKNNNIEEISKQSNDSENENNNNNNKDFYGKMNFMRNERRKKSFKEKDSGQKIKKPILTFHEKEKYDPNKSKDLTDKNNTPTNNKISDSNPSISSFEEENQEISKEIKAVLKVPLNLNVYVERLKRLYKELESCKKSYEEILRREINAILMMASKINKGASHIEIKINALFETFLYNEKKNKIMVLKIISWETKGQTVEIEQESNSESNNENMNNGDSELAKKTPIFNSLSNENNYFIKKSEEITSISNILNIEKNIEKNENNYSSEVENIFIKEGTLIPNKNLRTITFLKWFNFAFFIAIFFLNLFAFLFGPNYKYLIIKNASNVLYLDEKANLSTLEIYNLVLNFLYVNKGYYNEFLNTKELKKNYILKNKERLNEKYLIILQMNINKIIHKNIRQNKKLSYYKTFYNFSKNNNISLTINQLFDKFLYHIHEISLLNEDLIQENNTSIEFIRNFTIKELIKIYSISVNEFFDDIISDLSLLENIMIIVIGIEGGIFFASMIYFLRFVARISNNFMIFLEIYSKIDDFHLIEGKRYFKNLMNNFTSTLEEEASIREKSNITKKLISISKESIIGQHKKIKKISNSKKIFLQLKKKIYINFTFFILISLSLSIFFYFQLKTSKDDINKISIDGKYIFQKVSPNLLLLIALKEKNLNLLNYEIIYNSYFSNLIQSSIKIGNDIKNLKGDLNFYKNYEDYFFGKVCESLKKNITKKKICEKIAIGTLQKGLSSFTNYFLDIIDDEINLKKKLKFTNISMININEFDKAIDFYNEFLLKIMDDWRNDVNNYFDRQFTYMLIFIINIFAILSLSSILIYIILITHLVKEFKFFKNTYNFQMPNTVLSNDRMIKIMLIRSGMLKK